MTPFTAHFDTARDYIVQFTVTHKLICPQYGVYYRRLVAAFDGGRTPSSWFPNCPWPQLLPASNSISQCLNPIRSLIDCIIVNVTSRLTVYRQSLRLSCMPLCPYRHSPLWLEDGFISYEDAWPFTSVRIAYIACYCIQVLCQSRFAKQIVSSLLILSYTSGSVTWRLERS
jgi:hypothetical protein